MLLRIILFYLIAQLHILTPVQSAKIYNESKIIDDGKVLFFNYMLDEIVNITRYAKDIETTTILQVEKYADIAQLKLTQIGEKILKEIVDFGQVNTKYLQCVQLQRIGWNSIIQRAQDDIVRCYFGVSIGVQNLRTDILKLFDNLKIYEFIELCLDKIEMEKCDNNEAKNVIEESKRAITTGYQMIISGVRLSMMGINNANACSSNRLESAKEDGEEYFSSMVKNCSENV